MRLDELLLLAGLLQVEVNGVSIVRLAGVRLDAAQGGLRAFIAVPDVSPGVDLEHVDVLLRADRGTASHAGLAAADGGVAGGAGQVVQVDGGGEHHVGLPLHRLDVVFPSEPVPQLGPALVVLLAGAGVAVLVRVVGLQQPDVLPVWLLQSVVSLGLVADRDGHHYQTDDGQTTADLHR